jgi:arylsulfatase A-like enzyme
MEPPAAAPEEPIGASGDATSDDPSAVTRDVTRGTDSDPDPDPDPDPLIPALSTTSAPLSSPLSALLDAPLLSLLCLGALGGLLGGLATGAIDALVSWRGMAQFAEGLGRLRAVGFCACTYGLAGALGGLAATAALALLLRGSRLGELLRFGRRVHDERRAADPAGALTGLSLVLVGLPALALASAVAHELALPLLARRNPDLIVALIMLGMLGALAATAVVTLILARQIEHALAPLSRRLRWLSAPSAPLVTALLLALLGGVALLLRHWETARQLPLRPAAAILGLAALTVGAIPTATAALRRIARWRPWPRRLLAPLLALLCLIGMLGSGASPSTIKAVSAYSGLAGPIAMAVRRGFDRDRDGTSPLLGGGDCDDGDARIHPGAPELPDDGIDQNCVAGDAHAATAAHDLAFAPLAATMPPRPNILLLTIDTLRADHLGAYGYARPTSPAIDAVAREGALFEQSWAHAPSTRYSIPALLTGRLPLDVDYDFSVEGWPGLSPRATTIAEVLRSRGFATGAITNYWYFDRRRGMDQGFDEYDNDNARLHSSIPGAGPAETSGSSSREQTDKAIAFVDRHTRSQDAQPWFLWVHYYDPHYAYEAHPGSPSFGADRMALYDGEIRFTDEQIGRLLDALKQRGAYDQTIVAITGDHGEGFGEHGIELHGYHLYAAQTRVPMIVRVPGLPPRRSQTPMGHVDLLPTLANLAGVAPDDELLSRAMGRSMVDVLGGAPDRDRQVWQQLSYEGNHEMRGAASRTCHVLYNVSPSSSWEVYRLDRDPAERNDLAATGECGDTRRALEQWFDASQIPEGAAGALLPGRPALAATVDVDLGEAVRLLAVQVPPRARAGQTVDVTWTFEARGTPPAGWKVFAHVEGATRFSGDHLPARPLEWWKAGQFVRYTTKLMIPQGTPAGAYTVWAGLWKGSKRMPARSAKVRVEEDRAAVATIEVEP